MSYYFIIIVKSIKRNVQVHLHIWAYNVPTAIVSYTAVIIYGTIYYKRFEIGIVRQKY